MSDRCLRCRRPAPAIDSDEYAEWEAVIDHHGEYVGIICPVCLTAEGEHQMRHDRMESAASLSRCARCGKAAPGFNREDSIPEDLGWYILDSGLICTECMTPGDWDEAERASLEALRWRRRLSGS